MPHPKNPPIIVQGLTEKQRLDRVIRSQFPTWGRRAVQGLINAGRVKVNGRAVWLCSWRVQNGDRLDILAQPKTKTPPPAIFAEHWIIAQEADLIAVNKPAGLLSQPTRWTKTNNLLTLASDRFGPLTLFHRLDRDTSGVVLLTRPGPINRYLDAAFKARTIKKEYVALVPAKNTLSAAGTIETYIGPHARRRDMMAVVKERGKKRGKWALTHYQITAEAEGKQWLRLWPETGRTHQLRVHLAYMGAPILGDRLYGPKNRPTARLMLHARQIVLPAADTFPVRSYSTPLPEGFKW